MFKFLKDFLFEENEVAVATPTAPAAITSLDEKIDQGARTEQPVGSMGMSTPTPLPLPDKPFWNESTPTPPVVPIPKASAPTPPPAPIPVNKSIALDIQTKTEPEVQLNFTADESESVINFDALPESDVIAPEPIAVVEPMKAAEPIMAATPIPEPAPAIPAPMQVMEMSKPAFTPAPAPAPVMAAPAVEMPRKSDEENDLEQIDELLVKTRAEIEAEERAIADYEMEAKIIADKLASRRNKLTNLKETPGELEKTKADLEILLKNKKEVESKILDIRAQLNGTGDK